MQSLVVKHRNIKPCFWLLLERVRCRINSANRLPNIPTAYGTITPTRIPELGANWTAACGAAAAVTFETANSIGSRSCSASRRRQFVALLQPAAISEAASVRRALPSCLCRINNNKPIIRDYCCYCFCAYMHLTPYHIGRCCPCWCQIFHKITKKIHCSKY